RVWDAEFGRELLCIHAYFSAVTSVSFSPDGKRLASTGTGKHGSKDTVKLWDSVSGQQLLALGCEDYVGCQSIFSPDGYRLALSCSRQKTKTELFEGQILVWEACPMTAAIWERELVQHLDSLFDRFWFRAEVLAHHAQDPIVEGRLEVAARIA